jgi:hypothetical protein
VGVGIRECDDNHIFIGSSGKIKHESERHGGEAGDCAMIHA